MEALYFDDKFLPLHKIGGFEYFKRKRNIHIGESQGN